MHRGSAALVTLALLAVAALPAQVEVLAGPGPPSHLLETRIAKGIDDFVLFDVGCAAYGLLTELQGTWRLLEGERAAALRDVLPQLAGALAGSAAPDARRAAHVARVAAALLGDEAELDQDEKAERETVLSGRRASSHFVPETREVEWRIAVPSGGYANANVGEELPQLFRASVYLRECLLAMPAPMRGDWNEALERCGKEQRDRLFAVGMEWFALFGKPDTPIMSGVPGRYRLRDVERLAATDAASPWLALLDAHREVDAEPDASVRDALLHATHVLATETSTDPLLAAMPMDRWQAKWRDTADWLYVGLREVDVLLAPFGGRLLRSQPTVVIEPLPASFAALRELDRALCRIRLTRLPSRVAQHSEAEWWQDLLAELDVQTRGADPDAERQQRLFTVLLRQFVASDMLAGTESNLGGIQGALRRAGPFLVRVPIRWRGETKHALALRMYVEHAPTPGKWTGPPWGRELNSTASPQGR
jgi:hypothetical protein